MQCFVINLASATERMDRMRRILGDAGIAFTRFDAVDRKHAQTHPMRAFLPPPKRKEWSLSELGCLLSHFEIWRLIAASKEPFAAIFEDDIHIRPAELRKILESPTKSADVIKLETVFAAVRVGRSIKAAVPMRRLRTLHAGSGAYILSRRAAQQLINNAALFDVPVDHLLFDPSHAAFHNLARYQCVPALAVQDSELPISQKIGGFLSSDMPDRPVFGGNTRPPRGTLVQRALRAPTTLYQIGRGLSARLTSIGSEIVPF